MGNLDEMVLHSCLMGKMTEAMRNCMMRVKVEALHNYLTVEMLHNEPLVDMNLIRMMI